MVRNHYKDGQLIETADEHAKRLIEKRKASGKTGLPKAVRRYYKRTGFNPFMFSNEIQD